MKRLLFVDDEADILRGLKRMLRPLKNEWEVVLANSGDEALELLGQTHFDCIISDMRMPKMNGAELLTEVYEKYPHVARFVLSGYADSKPIIQAIPVTHQFLSKPCTPEMLTNAVRRALDLHDLVESEELKKVIGQVDSLPSRPEVFAELTRLLSDDDISLDDVSKVVEKDVAVSAKLLQVVNSAFFGLAQNMAKVRDAVAYLGVNMIKSLVLSEEMYRSFKVANSLPGFSIDHEYDESFKCAHVAKKLINDRNASEDAFMAGVLHRIGRLILAQSMPQKMIQALKQHRETGRPMHEVEAEVFGTGNERVGAYLLGLWGLPYPVVEAVAHYNAPWEVEHDKFQILDALYVAIKLVEQVNNPEEQVEINLDHLAKIGVADKLEEWKVTAAELLSGDDG